MSDYRALVTGSRDWSNPLAVYNALADACAVAHEQGYTRFIVVHGGCPTGADKHANRWTRFPDAFPDMPVLEEAVPADWDAPCRTECKPGHRRQRNGSTYCPAAGNYRNQKMVDKGADLCLAFFQPGAANRGTSDCVRRAKRAEIPLKEDH